MSSDDAFGGNCSRLRLGSAVDWADVIDGRPQELRAEFEEAKKRGKSESAAQIILLLRSRAARTEAVTAGSQSRSPGERWCSGCGSCPLRPTQN
jgi:hypothetical protein